MNEMSKYKEDLDKIKTDKYNLSQSQLQNPESPSKCNLFHNKSKLKTGETQRVTQPSAIQHSKPIHFERNATKEHDVFES